MASLFESLLYPVSIITSIVFAIVGVFWGLAITQTPVSFMAMLGIMILIGVIVNIGIVLIAHVIDLRKEGLNRHDAILEAARAPAAPDPDDDRRDAARDAAARGRLAPRSAATARRITRWPAR